MMFLGLLWLLVKGLKVWIQGVFFFGIVEVNTSLDSMNQEFETGQTPSTAHSGFSNKTKGWIMLKPTRDTAMPGPTMLFVDAFWIKNTSQLNPQTLMQEEIDPVFNIPWKFQNLYTAPKIRLWSRILLIIWINIYNMCKTLVYTPPIILGKPLKTTHLIEVTLHFSAPTTLKAELHSLSGSTPRWGYRVRGRRRLALEVGRYEAICGDSRYCLALLR